MKKNNISFELIPTLNCAVTKMAYPGGIPVPFTILYHEKTPALQFVLEAKDLNSDQFKVKMFRNLNNCYFSKTFFLLESVQDDNKDFQCKFGGINRRFEKDVMPVKKQKFDLDIGDPKRPPNNYLLIMGWKILGCEDDLNYYFVQRKCYNPTTRKNLIRTTGLQFSTTRGYETLQKYYDEQTNGFKKVTESVSFLEFEDKEITGKDLV